MFKRSKNVIKVIKRNYFTAKEVQEFKDVGLIFRRDFFSAEEKLNIVKWTNELQSWPEVKNKYMIYYEEKGDEKILCRMENYIPYHKGIAELFLGKINQAVSDLYQEPSFLYKDKINFKLPGGGAYEPHQDSWAFQHIAKKLHISVMIAVDTATKETGCLEFVHGKNKEFYPAVNGVLKPEVVEKWDKEGLWTPYETIPGDVVFFDSLIPHRSGPNKGKEQRRAYYLTYNMASEGDLRDKYYQDKRKQFPPEIEREVGKDYSEAGKIYNVANPISTIKKK